MIRSIHQPHRHFHRKVPLVAVVPHRIGRLPTIPIQHSRVMIVFASNRMKKLMVLLRRYCKNKNQSNFTGFMQSDRTVFIIQK